jgi:hypothetical protein
MRVLICALAVMLLAGCQTVTKTVTVEVPVPVACKTPDPPEPTLAFNPPYQDAFSGTRDLLGDRELMNGYIIELKAALKSCK